MADIIDTILKWFGETPQARPPTEQTLNTDKQKIMEIVEECAHKSHTGIPVADIVAAAKEIGIDEETTRAIVDELVRDGFLTRPRHMHDMVRLHDVTDFSPCSEDFPS